MAELTRHLFFCVLNDCFLTDKTLHVACQTCARRPRRGGRKKSADGGKEDKTTAGRRGLQVGAPLARSASYHVQDSEMFRVFSLFSFFSEEKGLIFRSHWGINRPCEHETDSWQ